MASSSSSTDPHPVGTLMQRADLAARGGRLSEAVSLLQQAAEHPAASAAELSRIAGACLTLDLPAAAYAVQRRIAALDPREPAPWRAMARCAARLGAPEDEVYALEQEAAARHAQPAYAFAELAMRCWRGVDFARARRAFARARELDPDYLPARWGEMQLPRELIHPDAAAAARFVAEWRAGLDWFEACTLERAPREQLASCVDMATNFYLHYHGEPFVDEQRRYARVIERMMDVLHPDRPIRRAPRADGRLRVGFCSSHLRHHTVLKLFGRLLTGLPRERFHLSAFHTDAARDADTDALATQVDAFEAGARPLGEWLQRLRAAELDALVYLDVGMQPITQGLASRRLAPFQAVLWGHPVTTGMRSIDALLSSAAMEPPDAARHYSERLLALPRLGIDYAAPGAPFDRLGTPPTIATDGVRAFVAQQAFKLTPAFDGVLARIAAAVPELRLHMTPHPSARVREPLHRRLAATFAAAGLELEYHLAHFDHASEAGFFRLAAAMDLNLDSIGWSGGNTTLEILAFDVPTVTLEGRLMRERHSAAMLRLLDLDALIARDEDDYVRIAVRLCRDRDWRLELRARIAERKHRLYDDPLPRGALADLLEAQCRRD
jgi:predicted O-linked N-acetylglucosamine transferase (SPINDLY family)